MSKASTNETVSNTMTLKYACEWTERWKKNNYAAAFKEKMVNFEN